jgi:hypothetical protein
MKIVEREASAKKLVAGCKIDPRLPEAVCGDPARLRHVILNLLDYSVRFTTSGSVILSAALESNSADDVLVRVAVADTGAGIPPDKQPLIFEPFRHADPGATLKSGETGLGLAISRRLVDLMGGTMKFQSQLGAGSTFEFTARFQKHKTAAQLNAPVRAPESLKLNDLSILVAEDKALDGSLIPETSSHGPNSDIKDREPATSAPLPDRKGFAIEPADNVFTPKFVEQEITIADDMPEAAAESGDSTRFLKQKTAARIDAPVHTPQSVELQDLSILFLDKALDRSLIAKTSFHDPSTYIEDPEPATSAPLPDLKTLAIEPVDNVFTPKYVEQEITTASDITGLATDSGDSSSDSAESDFAPETILSNPDDLALGSAGNSYISEADATSSTDFLHSGEIENPDASLYLLARMATGETDGFSGATRSAVNAEIENAPNIELDGACDIAIDAAEKLVIANSDDDVAQEVNQSAEIISVLACIEASYGNSDDSGPAANARVSAPTGLALLDATSQLTQQSSSLAKQDEGPTRSAAWDPFEQARKSLSKSRFDVRMIHNDGDPSDRNLI